MNDRKCGREICYAALAVAASLVVGVFGVPSAAAKPPHHFKSTEASSCRALPISRDRSACQIAYSDCAATAKRVVTAYWNGRGATLDTVAHRYAKQNFKSNFGMANPGAEEGCLAALMDEYDFLYR